MKTICTESLTIAAALLDGAAAKLTAARGDNTEAHPRLDAACVHLRAAAGHITDLLQDLAAEAKAAPATPAPAPAAEPAPATVTPNSSN